MRLTLVHVHGKAELLASFPSVTLRNHQGSTHERGNVCFDVLQSEEDPTQFVLYEVFKTAEDAAEHKKTAHHLEWRDAIAPWMAESRKGKPFRRIAPESPAAW